MIAAKLPSVREVLKTIRADLEGKDIISVMQYECEWGTLLVRNANNLIGVFEAELVGPNGGTVRVYKV